MCFSDYKITDDSAVLVVTQSHIQLLADMVPRATAS